jgi:enoyl-CoA hydratase
MMYNTLLVSIEQGVARITLNRPDKLNALNAELLAELHTVLTQLKDDTSLRVLVFTGAGEKSFVAGADISELHECNAETGLAFAQRGQAVFQMIEDFPVPVVAMVNGFALGGGCELALSCHVRYASSNAKFGQPEVKLGIIPGYGGTQRLTRLCGRAVAVELICGGGMINAERALQVGLVNGVAGSQEELRTMVDGFINNVLSMAPIAVNTSLDCIRQVELLSSAEGMMYEAKEFGRICSTNDFKEGTQAFLEKRSPSFSNS